MCRYCVSKQQKLLVTFITAPLVSAAYDVMDNNSEPTLSHKILVFIHPGQDMKPVKVRKMICALIDRVHNAHIAHIPLPLIVDINTSNNWRKIMIVPIFNIL